MTRQDSIVDMILHCPMCNKRHIDEGEFAIKPHHTHACQHCGHVWRPAIVSTRGVQFLPGFKNEPTVGGATLLGDKHVLFETGDTCAPDAIRDRNGEVVLGMCKRCGRVENELDEPCDDAKGWVGPRWEPEGEPHLAPKSKPAWESKRKGTSTIHTYPGVERAIVESFTGVRFAGWHFTSVDEAKDFVINQYTQWKDGPPSKAVHKGGVFGPEVTVAIYPTTPGMSDAEAVRYVKGLRARLGRD